MSVWIEGSELTLHAFDDEAHDRLIVVGPRLGHGGRALIFTGWFKERQEGDPEKLALKVLPHIDTPKSSKLRRRELKFSSTLRHRHIIPFFGTCDAEESTILVSPFMANGNLSRYLENNSHADRDLLVLQVSRALLFLHTNAMVVHGDLKCENVLVSDSGDAILADFGLSTTVEKGRSTSTKTPIRNMNTIQFSAPEILLPEDRSPMVGVRVRSKTCQSDIYAFGMFLLQAYTGKIPWRGLSQQAIILRMEHGDRPSQPDLLTMSGFLWSLCMECWKYDPSARPLIEEIVEFLELYLVVKNSPSTPVLLSESQDHLFELTKSLRALVANETRSLVMRIQAHLLQFPARVLDDYDVRILRKLLLTDSGVRALRDDPDAEKTIIDAMELLSSQDSADQDAAHTIADAALAILDLDAAEEKHNGLHFRAPEDNKSVYYSMAQLRTVVAWARQRNPRLADRLEERFAPAQVQAPLKHPEGVICVAYMPDGDHIVSGCHDGAVRVLGIQTGQVVGAPMTGHTNSVWSVAVSKDGTQIASGSLDNTVRVWNTETGGILAVLEGHDNWVRSVAFSLDGKRVASGSDDKTIRMWDVASGMTVVGPIKRHSHWVWSVAYSPDGLRIASGADGVRVWDAQTGEELWQVEIGFGVYSVGYSRDGSRIVAGCQDGRVHVLDAETGRVVLGPLTGHTSRVNSVAFSPDGTKIASGSDDNTVRIWDAETGAELDALRGHRTGVRSVAFSPDGKHIASASRDKTIRIWDATGEWKRW